MELCKRAGAHINRSYSTLTKIQAFALDAHFTLEQVGRNSQGHFINFNGTAGLWRKECIYDARKLGRRYPYRGFRFKLQSAVKKLEI